MDELPSVFLLNLPDFPYVLVSNLYQILTTFNCKMITCKE